LKQVSKNHLAGYWLDLVVKIIPINLQYIIIQWLFVYQISRIIKKHIGIKQEPENRPLLININHYKTNRVTNQGSVCKHRLSVKFHPGYKAKQ